VTTAATTDKVILRGLTITGQTVSTGIHVTAQLASLHIENCVVTVSGTGISINAAGEYFIKDTIVRNNLGNGILFAPVSGTSEGTVEHCRMENNGGDGLRVENNSTVAVRDSVSAGNDGSGFFAGSDLSVENCLGTRNGSNGVFAFSGSTVRVSNSTLVKNGGYGLFNVVGTLRSSGNNITDGNGGGPTVGPITPVSVN
jgi:hypothetical protein